MSGYKSGSVSLEEVYILGSPNVYMRLIEEVETTLRILDDEHHSTKE